MPYKSENWHALWNGQWLLTCRFLDICPWVFNYALWQKKSGFALGKVNDVLKELKVPLIDNHNIVEKHLGDKGLLLSKYGKASCHKNYIAATEKLWCGYLKCILNKNHLVLHKIPKHFENPIITSK